MNLQRCFTVTAILLLLTPVACQKKKGDLAAPTKAVTETKGEAAQAIEIALEKVKAAPNFENYTALGLAYAKLSFYRDALEVFKKSATFNANSEVAANNICSQHIELKEWKSAKIYCESALRLNPKFTVPANNLKIIEAAFLRLKDEATRIQKTLSTLKDLELTDALLNLGMVYFEMQDFTEAVRVWTKVPKGSPKYSLALNNLASVNILMKKYNLAAKQLNEAEKLDPRNSLIQNNKRWLEQESKIEAK